jgi:hypothetical protein
MIGVLADDTRIPLRLAGRARPPTPSLAETKLNSCHNLDG